MDKTIIVEEVSSYSNTTIFYEMRVTKVPLMKDFRKLIDTISETRDKAKESRLKIIECIKFIME